MNLPKKKASLVCNHLNTSTKKHILKHGTRHYEIFFMDFDLFKSYFLI